jgi:hypothetical protein
MTSVEFLSCARDGPPSIAGVDAEKETITTVVVKVTSQNGPCDEIGLLYPNLVHLELKNSCLHSIRDLGTSFRCLRTLKATHCGLSELDGISGLVVLEELYLAFNDIQDLTPLAFHERIQVLDVESNRIVDVLQIVQLGTCALDHLTLTGNPIRSQCQSFSEYRELIFRHIPSLMTLDDDDDGNGTFFTEAAGEHSGGNFPIVSSQVKESDLVSEEIRQIGHNRPNDAETERFSRIFKKISNVSCSPSSEEAHSCAADTSVSSLTYGTSLSMSGNVCRGLRQRQRLGPEQDDETTLEMRASSAPWGDEVTGLWPSPNRDLIEALPQEPEPVVGMANRMDERVLVDLLRRRPKDVPVLRTRSSFQQFFHGQLRAYQLIVELASLLFVSGMERSKLKRLLRLAYSDLNPTSLSTKIEKRMQLFELAEEAGTASEC